MTQPTTPHADHVTTVDSSIETAREQLREAADTVHTGANTNTDIIAAQEIADSLPAIRDALKKCDVALATLETECETEDDLPAGISDALSAAQHDHGLFELLEETEASLSDEKLVMGRDPDMDARSVEPLILDLQDALEQKHRAVRTAMSMVTE